jgi:signal transduction histidine kinase
MFEAYENHRRRYVHAQHYGSDINSQFIITDVLTMSKLDSGLFVMTPVEVKLESIARDAVKMFEGEARSAGITLDFQVDDSCKQADIDSVWLDPTRVLQILIVCIVDTSNPSQTNNDRTS